LVEVDGVALCEAQEVKMSGPEHEEVEIHTGTRDHPILVKGKYKVPEVEIKQARALNNEGSDFIRLFQDYRTGANMAKPTVRIVTLGEDGQTVIATDEYTECVPKKFKPGDKKADGKEADTFDITFRPTAHEAIY
jgi:hypothetical protein